MDKTTEIKVGDRVVVTNVGARYTTYYRWANAHIPAQFRYADDKIRLKEGFVGRVVAVANHSEGCGNILYAIVKDGDDKAYIIEQRGLQVIDNDEKVKNEIEILFENKWVNVVSKNGYVYTQLPWCNSMGVSILPYRYNQRKGKREYLAVYEHCVPHADYVKLGCITGGCDKDGKGIREVALEEVYEEGGIDVRKSFHLLESLGYVRPNKASDVITYLFAIDVTGMTWNSKPAGDGTGHEDDLYPIWINENDAINSEDPVLATMMARLLARLGNKEV